MKIINKITAVLAAYLTVSLAAFAQETAPLDLSVTLAGFTPEVLISDSTGAEVGAVTFPALDSDGGTFTAVSSELTVEVAHSRNAKVTIYSDDLYSAGFDGSNILFLKREGSPVDTEGTPNPDNVSLRVFVTEVVTGGSTFQNPIPGSFDDVPFVFDVNSPAPAESLLMNAVGNAESTVKFVFGVDATNSVPDTYVRSLTVESALE
ncbi:MAG: hypothetical protein ACJAT5_000688 [Lentimonas sp.]|jgi:hypothetical protein